MNRCVLSLFFFGTLSIVCGLNAAEPQWQQSESSIAVVQGDHVLWQFNFGDELHKPYFHPITVGERVLTVDRPADHIWHHGLWFSWKYINGVNYWEINGKTGKPNGTTSWEKPKIEARDDHSAKISTALSYAAASDNVLVLSEQRTIDVSSRTEEGSITIDWLSVFTAEQDVNLDRTPFGPQAWGGYSGLSARLSEELIEREAIGTESQLEFTPHRHRSRGDAVDYTGTVDGTAIGLAFFDHPSNVRHPTKWYVIRSPVMSFMNAAVIHDAPLDVKKGEQLTLRYRLIAHPKRWDTDRLQKEYKTYLDSVEETATTP